MKLFFTDQTQNFEPHLEQLKNTPVMKYDIKDLVEKTTTIKIPLEYYKDIHQYDLKFLTDFHIFPIPIMKGFPQWKLENRAIKIGDTILQQVHLPPIQNFSQKIIFGVRVKEIINEADKIGFTYETLEGHVEKGTSTFTAEINNDSKELIFKIKTFSKPGNFLSRLMGPIFSVPYQTYCTNRALKNLKRNFLKFNIS